MQKLVLTYTDTDECTYSADVQVCFMYESKEKAIVDFGSALLKKIEDTQRENKERNVMMNEINNLRSKLQRTAEKDKTAVYKKINELYGKVNNSDSSFSFAGKAFHLHHYYKQPISDEDESYIEEPRIQTLDEWFSTN